MARTASIRKPRQPDPAGDLAPEASTPRTVIKELAACEPPDAGTFAAQRRDIEAEIRFLERCLADGNEPSVYDPHRRGRAQLKSEIDQRRQRLRSLQAADPGRRRAWLLQLVALAPRLAARHAEIRQFLEAAKPYKKRMTLSRAEFDELKQIEQERALIIGWEKRITEARQALPALAPDRIREALAGLHQAVAALRAVKAPVVESEVAAIAADVQRRRDVLADAVNTATWDQLLRMPV